MTVGLNISLSLLVFQSDAFLYLFQGCPRKFFRTFYFAEKLTFEEIRCMEFLPPLHNIHIQNQGLASLDLF